MFDTLNVEPESWSGASLPARAAAATSVGAVVQAAHAEQVGVAHDGHEQPVRHGHGHAELDVLVLPHGHAIGRGVEERKLAQRLDGGGMDEVGDRDPEPADLSSARRLQQVGHVHRDRHRERGHAVFSVSRRAIVWRIRLSGSPPSWVAAVAVGAEGPRPRRRSLGQGGPPARERPRRLDVALHDASAWPRAGHAARVDAQLGSQPTGPWADGEAPGCRELTARHPPRPAATLALPVTSVAPAAATTLGIPVSE